MQRQAHPLSVRSASLALPVVSGFGAKTSRLAMAGAAPQVYCARMGEVSPSRGAEPGDDAPGGLQRFAGKRSTLLALAVAAAVAIGALVATVQLTSGPRSDATLQLVASEPDVQILAILAGEEQWAAIDPLTLRGYEPYEEVEVWSAMNGFGSPCLIAFERARNDVVSTSCVPEPAELFIDVWVPGWPDSGRTRFMFDRGTRDVHVYIPDGAK